MAVRVDGDVLGHNFKAQRFRFLAQQIVQELFDQPAPGRNLLGPGQFQFSVILSKHRIAGWLQEQDRHIVASLRQQRQIVLPQPHRLRQIPLAECRTATTLTVLKQGNLKARRLQHPHRRNPNVRLIITHKCVVPKNHPPPRRRLEMLPLRKPAVESNLCEPRQRPPGRDIESPGQQLPHQK